MTVRELREILANVADENVIVLLVDQNGNAATPLFTDIDTEDGSFLVCFDEDQMVAG